MENVFSLKSGPIFKIQNMEKETIKISNSEFKNFKSGSGEQLIQYFSRIKCEYNYDKQNYKLMFQDLQSYVNNNEADNNKANNSKANKRPKLVIDNCTIDNREVVNRLVNYLYQMDAYDHRSNIKKD